MSRSAKYDTGINTTVTIPTSVINQVKWILRDPLTGRTQYGALSSLVTYMLREWLKDPARQKQLANMPKDNSLDTLPPIG